jgi:hypothetical protein
MSNFYLDLEMLYGEDAVAQLNVSEGDPAYPTTQEEFDRMITFKSGVVGSFSDILAISARRERNSLLLSTDAFCLTDRNPTNAMLEYRQALRDITAQVGFPIAIEWPVKPE